MMKTIALCALVIVGLVTGPAARAQIQETTVLSEAERLDQIVAPVALYPDTVLTQVFMAATYPLEVVEADRFARDNPRLSAEAAEAALRDRNWDPSVKALVAYPDVLKMMSENLQWTRDLGDAFLTREAALFDAVQRMRQRARDAGTLTTTTEQVVTVRPDRIIVVEPANPSVVYVPTYSPYWAYSGWYQPSWYYPSLYGWWPHSGFSFSIGFGWGNWGSWFWGYPSWHWGGSSVFVDVDRYNRFNRRSGYRWSERDLLVRDRGDWGTWRHDSRHRRGVRYSDSSLNTRFGQRAPIRTAPVVQAPSRIEQPRVEKPRFEQSRLSEPRLARPRFDDRRIESQWITQPRVEKSRTAEPRIAQPRIEQPRFEPSRREALPAPRAMTPPKAQPRTEFRQQAQPRTEFRQQQVQPKREFRQVQPKREVRQQAQPRARSSTPSFERGARSSGRNAPPDDGRGGGKPRGKN
jgi:hypothetical protein